jgi:hypothetical protein
MRENSVAALVVVLITFTPSYCRAAPSAKNGTGREYVAQIARWNNVIKTNPRTFSWKAHNELRHLYITNGEEVRSMQQADIILAHSLMDNYMLHILSDWQLHKDDNAAFRALMNKANRYRSLRFLRIACLLQSAQIREKQNTLGVADVLYLNAENLARVSRRSRSKASRTRLAAYQKLAHRQRARLHQLQRN